MWVKLNLTPCSDVIRAFAQNKYVAIKIAKGAKQFKAPALDEIKILRAIHKALPNDTYRLKIVQIYDSFQIHGPNGTRINF